MNAEFGIGPLEAIPTAYSEKAEMQPQKPQRTNFRNLLKLRSRENHLLIEFIDSSLSKDVSRTIFLTS